MIYYKKQPAGFSLVETLVAVTILLIVIVGPMTLAANATRGTNFSSEQVIASFLAQEGAELAQKNRDDTLLPFFVTPGTSNQGWNATGFPGCSETVGGCGMWLQDDLAGTVASAGGCNANPENCRVYLNDDLSSRQRYVQASAVGTLIPTIYYRTVSYDNSVPDEIRIVSEVTWRTGNQNRVSSTSVQTYLYNVYGR